LFKFRKGETEYGIGWLPLGGYCKISGMIDESMDVEQMKQPPQPYEFRSKSAGQRLLIMVGGVLFNFILALVIYAGVLYAWGETYLPTANVKYGIQTDDMGHSIGLLDGDKILSVDGEYIDNFFQIQTDILLNDRKTIQVERDGQQLNIDIPKEYVAAALKGQGEIDARVPFSPFVIADFGKESVAGDAGMLKNDELTGINGVAFEYYDQFRDYLKKNTNQLVILNVLRDGSNIDIPVNLDSTGLLGVATNKSYAEYFELATVKYGILSSIPAGIKKGIKTGSDYLKQFKILFAKDTKAYESLGGFITIGSIFPGTWDWQVFWNMTAFLSIILAVMNILPIPALDGGHVLFLLVEVITGRKPSDKFLENAQVVGMIILLALLVFANGNDIIRLIRK
jgi:regulator of sigma E protease